MSQQGQDALKEKDLTLQQVQDVLKEKDLTLQQTQARLKETEVTLDSSKKTGRDVYRIRDGSSGSFDTTTRSAMKNTLAALKDKHGKELYVKVIIPENSGLSYSDAWRFTTEMQRAFDYYYQENDE